MLKLYFNNLNMLNLSYFDLNTKVLRVAVHYSCVHGTLKPSCRYIKAGTFRPRHTRALPNALMMDDSDFIKNVLRAP
jgi:hypothetical protein